MNKYGLKLVKIKSGKVQMLNFWVIIKELTFDKPVSKVCSKASKRLRVLARLSQYLTFKKKMNIFKTLVES